MWHRSWSPSIMNLEQLICNWKGRHLVLALFSSKLINSVRLNLTVWSRRQRKNLSLFDRGRFYIKIIYFYKDLFCFKLATTNSYKAYNPTTVDNEGKPWGPIIMLWTTMMVFIYVYRIDINVGQLIYFSKKHNLHLKNIPC